MGEPSWCIDDPRACVFINCPFDGAFTPLLHAIVFTITSCGFVPRSAIESGSGAAPRMERIVRAIEGSRYSIHDFSRCRGEGDANLARFNMPLELGFAMSRRFLAKAVRDSHDWLVLLPEDTSTQNSFPISELTMPKRIEGRPE